MGFGSRELYEGFAEHVRATKRGILSFLIEQKNSGKSIVGYGAPGKGNTLLNFCGIREDFLDYTVDLSPHKQNTFTPGTRIPVYSPDKIKETQPDFVFILPWNLKDEIVSQHSYINEWGGVSSCLFQRLRLSKTVFDAVGSQKYLQAPEIT